jgi:hypothetical protein
VSAALTPIDQLVAKQAITEVIYAYCRAIDRLDRELAQSVWHPDATADYGQYYVGSGQGFVDYIWATHPQLVCHSHQVTNIHIELLSDDTAVSESCAIVQLRPQADGDRIVDLVHMVRYLDRWSLRDDVWGLDARQCTVDLARCVQTARSPDADTIGSRSRRNRDDPSYTLFSDCGQDTFAAPSG